jgi:copper chaperone
MKEITIKISGMSCEHCVKNVKKALQNIDGVTSVDVKIGEAVLSLDSDSVTMKDIEKAIADAGYSLES